MKVCIFGAGALGGHLGARLIAGKQAEVSMVGRGANLAAIRERGITVKSGGQEVGGKPAAATDDPKSLPPQDVVFVSLKAHTLAAAADSIAGLLKPDGCAVFLLNGIPWWLNYGLPGEKGTLPLLDPGARLWDRVGARRVIGSVVYSPNEMVTPGVVVHSGHNKWVFGEPDKSQSPRLQAICELVRASGIETEASPDIRRELFRKLANNASNNTLCSLTRLDSAGIANDDAIARLSMSIMRETLAVAAKLGTDLTREINVEQNAIRQRGKSGAKPSTLQDVLAGKSLEIEALLGQTQAFGVELGVPTPVIDVCVALMRGLDTSLRSS